MSLTKHFRTTNKVLIDICISMCVGLFLFGNFGVFTSYCFGCFYLFYYSTKNSRQLFLYTNKHTHTHTLPPQSLSFISRPLSHPPAASNVCRVILHFVHSRVCFGPYAQSQFNNHKQTTKTNAMLNLLNPKIVR